MARIITILDDFGSEVCVSLEHWGDGLKVGNSAKTCARCYAHLPAVLDPSSVQSSELVPAVQRPRIAFKESSLMSKPMPTLEAGTWSQDCMVSHTVCAFVLCHRTGPAIATCCRLHHGVISVVGSSA